MPQVCRRMRPPEGEVLRGRRPAPDGPVPAKSLPYAAGSEL